MGILSNIGNGVEVDIPVRIKAEKLKKLKIVLDSGR
jgi:hypothetical protein